MKNTITYIIAGLVLIAVIVWLVMRGPSKVAPTDTTGTPATSVGTTTTGGNTTGTTGGTTTPPADMTHIHTTSIKLLSPLDGGSIAAGTTSTWQYQLTAPVAYGTITLGANDCSHEIMNGIVGTYTFTCAIPKNYIGSKDVTILEKDLKNSTVTKSKNDFGSVKIILPAGVTATAITHSPAGTVPVRIGAAGASRPYVNLIVAFSDKVERMVMAEDFQYSIADTSIATMEKFYNTNTAYIIGKKVGTTNLTVTYGTLTSTFPIQVKK